MTCVIARHAQLIPTTLRTYSVFRPAHRLAASAEGTAPAAAGGFLTLEGEHRAEVEVRKSRFLAAAWPVAAPAEALARIAAASDPGASHNCWAYRIGQQYRSSDDGEPGGTAGRPILSAIEGEGLDNTCVLVTRYFGTKLGAGGLVRAYAKAARECLRGAATRRVLPRVALTLDVPFELLGSVYALIELSGAEKEAEEYGVGEAGDGVRLTLAVIQDRAPALAAAVQEATGGRVVPVLLQPGAD